MPTSSLAQILLRIFALNWFLFGLLSIVTMTFQLHHGYFTWLNLVPSVIYLVGGIGVWMVSPKLSRVLAHRNDGEFNLTGVTEQQLYTAVFLGFGLYFTLTSFAAAFGWVHFFAVVRPLDSGFHLGKEPSYYDMTETLITLAAGIFLILTCKIWARKLCQERPAGQDAP